jgi:hypothetical protein
VPFGDFVHTRTRHMSIDVDLVRQTVGLRYSGYIGRSLPFTSTPATRTALHYPATIIARTTLLAIFLGAA